MAHYELYYLIVVGILFIQFPPLSLLLLIRLVVIEKAVIFIFLDYIMYSKNSVITIDTETFSHSSH